MTHLLAFAAMCLIWGLTWLPTKMAAAAMSPISVAACRFVLAGLLFFAYARLTGASLRTRQPARLVAASLLITTGCYAAVFWGVAHAPSGLSAIINFSSMPILIALIGAAYGEERITPPRIAAVGLGIVGLAVLFLPQMSGLEDASAVPGLVSVAIGTASYAWGAVISRPLVRELPPASIAFWETFLGGLALIPLAIGIEGWHPERYANFVHDPVAIGSLAFMIVFGSLTAFTIYLWLLRDWGAFRAGLYAFVSPAIAVLVGTLYGGEAFGWTELVGMAAMFAATFLAMAPARSARTSAASG